MQATSLVSIDTEYSADCIEWCPSPGYQDLFICGTYQVVEPSTAGVPQSLNGPSDGDGSEEDEERTVNACTQRTGRLLLFQVNPADPAAIREVQRLETNAILDAKWFNTQHSVHSLAVADAKGQITIYTLTASKHLELSQSIQVGSPSVLVLSLDISPASAEAPPDIAFSLSDGSLGILTFEDDRWTVKNTWHGHDFEPWCIAWDKWDSHTVWSGGDDLKLKRWDIRDTSTPTFTNSRYEAGITTITSSPHTPHLLAVGSYDSCLRIYDARSPRQLLKEINVGGGVWRTKFHPDSARGDELLLATMHDGFKVVKLDLTSEMDSANGDVAEHEWTLGTPQIVKRFDEHTSLAYGADWSRIQDAKGGTTVATCSFYDHTMHLWRG